MKNLKQKYLKTSLVLATLGIMSTAVQAQTFEAENYSRYFDTSVGNNGGAFRSDDVDIETSYDTNGGFNVGWIDATEWLAFDGLNITESGNYLLKMRVASPSGAQAAVDLNSGGIPLANIDIPNTGGWQNWTTVETTVNLNAGRFDLGVYAQSGGWNFNWVSLESQSEPEPSSKIEAEDYTDFSDTTAGNSGGTYRTDDVDIETTTDTGGGYNVGWWDTNEWLSYDNINIASAGNYQIKLRVSSPTGASASVDLNSGAVALGQVNIPATGGWQNWQTVTVDANLTAGSYSLGVYSNSSGWNLNWIEIVKGGSDPTDPTLVWGDEFDGIDSSVWNKEVGGHGFGNNELQWYSDGNNVRIEFDAQAQSNVLVIEARKEQGGMCWYGENCGYTSGKLTTQHKKSFKYGRIEARMKLPKVKGIWPAFWMLGDNFNTQGWPQGGEIDIMEHVNTNNITSGALHGPGYSGNTPVTGHLEHAGGIDQDYHVYAVEWDANGMQWYVDDINFYSITKEQVEQYGEYVYDAPFWILLNLAVGGNWPGDPDHANFGPTHMYVDYVRVYSK